MTKYLLLPLSLALCSSAALADVEQITSSVLNGEMIERCLFDPLDPVSSGGAEIRQSDDGLTVNFNSIVDPETAEVVPFGLMISFDVSCNFPHTVSIRSNSGGLQSSTPAQTDQFSDRADYNVDASWAGGAAGFLTTGTPGEGVGMTVGGLNAGRFDIQIGSASSETPLVSGDYSDTLVIEITSTP